MKYILLFILTLCIFNYSYSQSNRVYFDVERQNIFMNDQPGWMPNIRFTNANSINFQYGLGYERIIKNRIKIKGGFSSRRVLSAFTATGIEIDTHTNLLYSDIVAYYSTNFLLRASLIVQNNDHYQLSVFGGLTYRNYRSYNYEDRLSFISTKNFSTFPIVEEFSVSENPYQIDYEYGVNFDFFIDSKKKHILSLGVAFSKQYYSRFNYRFKVYEAAFDGNKTDNILAETNYPISNTPYLHTAFQFSYAYAFGK